MQGTLKRERQETYIAPRPYVGVGQSITMDLPMVDGESVYFVAIGNSYGAGGVWIVKTAPSSSAVSITNIAPSSYFSVESVSATKIKVNAGQAGGFVGITKIC